MTQKHSAAVPDSENSAHSKWAHTRSIPIVSWIPVSKASFSFVPTPSVPATRKWFPIQTKREEIKLSERATQERITKVGINILLCPSKQQHLSIIITNKQHMHLALVTLTHPEKTVTVKTLLLKITKVACTLSPIKSLVFTTTVLASKQAYSDTQHIGYSPRSSWGFPRM